MRITKQVREHISLATERLDEMGIPWTVEICSRHSKLIYWVDGKQMVAPVSNSSSDRRARLNFRSNVCKIVQQNRGIK
jgi:hypothetical protein